ncbi:MAG: anthranilate synthase component I [Alphaproteobacteria bacterium]|nr:anthranilate synthase component I [Alphaproteobacteria bacterium]
MTTSLRYVTRGGIAVARHAETANLADAMEPLLAAIDRRRGALLVSSYEFPGRYKRWSMGFVDPPLTIESRGLKFTVRALNARGRLLVGALAPTLSAHPDLVEVERAPDRIDGRIRPSTEVFAEEQRSRQPSVFSLLRAVREVLFSAEDEHLGLYGAFGYDLVHQFEPVPESKPRADDQRDLVVYLPDTLTIIDYHRQAAFRLAYDFTTPAGTTIGRARDGASVDWQGSALKPNAASDLPPGGYAKQVETVMERFRVGDMFETVLSQTYYRPSSAAPRLLFDTLRQINPSPYGFLFNLGEGEYLIGASPEMYVRVEGRRVETCPISGTIARGRDAIEDAERIKTLLNSAKDEAELTMCTDVDRNDKARICEPGSVRVLGRRQIEMYSHLIHTVDHVEGVLRPEFDALDAFLTHCWAVTVTGAPKPAAIAYLERHEATPRRWYGGAVGKIGFDGGLNTGLTLRTIRLKDQIAEIRVGATLLHDSIPAEEERECEVKAAASMRTIELAERGGLAGPAVRAASDERPGAGKRVLLVDCEDSFVHMLADYFRRTGAMVETRRHGLPRAALLAPENDLVVLSPGPGRPEQFGVPDMVRALAASGRPAFGVCLGFQGMVEAFGGALGVLPLPYHGKPSQIVVQDAQSRLFRGLPERFAAGRYHSLYALAERIPPELKVVARSQDDVAMAIEHRTLPLMAVQFHPESLMTLGGEAGPQIVANVMRALTGR